MKKKISVHRKKRAVCVMGTTLVLALCAPVYSSGQGAMPVKAAVDYEKKTSEAEQEKKVLEQENKQLKKQDDVLQEKKSATQEKLDELARKEEKLKKEAKDLKKKIKKTNRKKQKLEDQIVSIQQKQEEERKSMGLRMKSVYESKDSSFLNMILSAKNLRELWNRAEYIIRIASYDKAQMEALKKTAKEVQDKQAEVKEQAKLLKSQKQELAQSKADLKALQDEKQTELKEYSTQLAANEVKEEKNQAEIDKQEALIEELLLEKQKQIEEQKRIEKEKEEKRKREEEQKKAEEQTVEETEEPKTELPEAVGNFAWPLTVSGRISSYFGSREQPVAGASTYHKGIDIAAPTGTGILAAESGEVVIAQYSSSAGYYIMIYHGNSTYTVYMHCSSLGVSVGQHVSKGENIGKVGSTGYSSGPHLHFGVSVNGTYIDPLQYYR